MRRVGEEHHVAPGIGHRVDDRVARRDHRDRYVATAQPLGGDEDVGRPRVLLVAPPAARAAEPAHDLVGDREHAVVRAHLLHHHPVVLGRHERATGGADHRLGDERRHSLRAGRLDRRGEGVGVVPRRLRPLGEQRFVPAPPCRVATGRERGQRGPVVARLTTDDLVALLLPVRQVVVARQAEGGVVRLAATGGEEHVIEAFGQPVLDELVSQGEARGRRPRGHDVVELHHRRRHRFGDLAPAVADVRDEGAGRPVEDAPAIVPDQLAPLGPHDRRAAGRGGEPIARDRRWRRSSGTRDGAGRGSGA